MLSLREILKVVYWLSRVGEYFKNCCIGFDWSGGQFYCVAGAEVPY
jgi:hypothetical protein